jgi:hypothetical protein
MSLLLQWLSPSPIQSKVSLLKRLLEFGIAEDLNCFSLTAADWYCDQVVPEHNFILYRHCHGMILNLCASFVSS